MASFKRVAVGTLCSSVCSGGTPKSSVASYYDGEIPWLNTKEVNFNRIYSTERTISQQGLDNSSAKWIPANTVVVAMYGATAGRCAIAGVPMTTNQACCNLTINQALADYRFVYYALCLDYARLSSAANGGAQQNLNAQVVRQFDIACPPLPTQRKIAAVLSSLDDKIETNNAICRNLEEQADALFNKCIEEGNMQVPFLSLVEVQGGGTPKTGQSEYWSGEIPFFTPKDVSVPFTFETGKSLTREGLAHCNSPLYPAWTTFVTARGTVGKLAMAGLPMAMNQSCYALVGKKIHPILAFMYSRSVVHSLKKKSTGSVFDAIVTRDFETENVKRLSDERKFIDVALPMYERIYILMQENNRLAALRDTLLPRLMSGELDVSAVNLR